MIAFLGTLSTTEASDELRRLLGVLLFVTAGFVLIYLMARWRDRVRGVPVALSDPPEPVHPVDVALLWALRRKHLSPKTAFRAEIVHLASSGTIALDTVGLVSDPEDLRITLREDPEPGLDGTFVEYMFGEDAAEDSTVLMSRLDPGPSNNPGLRRWWGLSVSGIRGLLYRVWGGVRAEWVAASLLGLLVAPVGVANTAPKLIADLHPATLALFAGGVEWLICAWALPPRFSRDVRHRIAAWEAFRRYILDFSSLREAPAAAVVLWGQHLSYAVALNAAHNVERQIRAISVDFDAPPPWDGAPGGSSGAAWVRHILRRGPREVPPGVQARFGETR